MEFFTYDYFVNQSNNSHIYQYLLIILILLITLLFILKRSKNKSRLKYRDLIILLSLLLVFLIGIQTNDYQKGKIERGNYSQMLFFLNSVSKKKSVDPEVISVNYKYLKDEMVLKIHNKYYQVNFNNDFTTFKLEETVLVNDESIKVTGK
ncbi:DUF3290 family protein [Vagococcus sp. JNUCC 83]